MLCDDEPLASACCSPLVLLLPALGCNAAQNLMMMIKRWWSGQLRGYDDGGGDGLIGVAPLRRLTHLHPAIQVLHLPCQLFVHAAVLLQIHVELSLRSDNQPTRCMLLHQQRDFPQGRLVVMDGGRGGGQGDGLAVVVR